MRKQGAAVCVDIPRNCLMELSPRVRTLCMKRGGKYKQAGRCPFTNNNQSKPKKPFSRHSLSLYLALALTTYYCLICIIRQKVCQPPCVGYVPTYMLCVCYYGQHLIHYISHNTSASFPLSICAQQTPLRSNNGKNVTRKDWTDRFFSQQQYYILYTNITQSSIAKMDTLSWYPEGERTSKIFV